MLLCLNDVFGLTRLNYFRHYLLLVKIYEWYIFAILFHIFLYLFFMGLFHFSLHIKKHPQQLVEGVLELKAGDDLLSHG